MEVTLDELLQSRDNRHQMHLDLLEQYPGRTLVSVTVVMPGPVKNNTISIQLANKAEAFLRRSRQLQIEYMIRRDLNTGPEIYCISRLPVVETKRICCRIEDGHPLGRLWDFDVVQPNSVPLSRTELGLAPRKCIICGSQDAIDCIRSRRHTKASLYARVEEIFKLYQNTSDDYEL